MNGFEVLITTLKNLGVLIGLGIILGVVSMVVFFNFSPHGKEVLAQAREEGQLKGQAEADKLFVALTQADWVLVRGDLTENGEIRCIVRSKSRVGEQIRSFNYSLPNVKSIKIGDHFRLERKQGASDPYEDSSFNIIPVNNGG